MRFTNPLALLLFLVMPIVVSLGWPARGPSRRREALSLALRMLIITCLIFSLAGMEIRRTSSRLASVFLVDISDSMPETAISAAVQYIQAALQGMHPDDQAAIIAFGAEALVERPMSPSRDFIQLASVPATNQTDLEEAIRLGLALYPPDAGRRMVILSDGAATSGDASQAVRLAQNSGVHLLFVPFVTTPGPEVWITDLEAPTHLRQGDQFDLNLTLQASQPTSTGIQVIAGDQVVYQGQYQLNRGVQSFSMPLVAGEPGFVTYRVLLDPQQDSMYQNNEAAAFSQVAGPPKLLVVAPQPGEPIGYQGVARPDEFTPLVNALQAAGFLLDRLPPSGLPSELPLLANYSAVVLVDVPARQLSQRQMTSLQHYVRDLGGGLVVVGGPTSYGVGGYFRTPLEASLPVEMQIKDEQRRPSLAMIFVIDHSGSMAESSGGAAKIELAKEAAIRSVDLLSPMDRVGVVAFDDSASWVVPITELSDPSQVQNAIASIRADGGTDILAGLQAVAQQLPGDPASVKHIILLTDGGADPTGIPELVQSLHDQYNITLTTVGVGRDAAQFLPGLAEIGGGRYHFAADPGSIPSIFTEETSLATRSYIIEETFYPQQTADSPILTGIQALPPLYGYVGTTAKESAQTILVSDQGDPILAAWQYGLGKAVAFTSDASGRWAQAWVAWQGFPLFWSQAVRSVVGEPLGSTTDIQVTMQGEAAQLVVEARSPGQGSYLNGYDLHANLVAPDGESLELSLQQVAPGRYQGAFQPDQQGVYLIRVTGSPPDASQPAADQPEIAETTGWVLPYSPEYRQPGSNTDLLLRLLNQTTGSAAPGQLTSGGPAEVFQRDFPLPKASRPIWPWLVGLAACLLPLDIASRRLVVTRRDWQGALQRLQENTTRLAARLRHAETASPLPRATQIENLLRAKERGEQRESRGSASPSQAAPPTRTDQLSKAPRVEKADRSEVKSPSERTSEQDKTSDASTAAALLARKRARQERRDSS
jgi:Ca-activated chloride channel family protein